MRYFWLSALVAICLSWTAAGVLAADQPPKAATVNGSIITKKELDREFDLFTKRMARQGRTVSDEQTEALRSKLLDNLIDMTLLAQESKRQHITVKDDAVEKKMDEFRMRSGGPERFQANLKRMGMTESSLKSKIRESIAVRELISRKVEPGISVSEKEVRSLYDQHKSAFHQPEQVRARHILVKVGPETDKKEARKKIEAARRRLENGEDFAAVAAEVSEGPSRSKGGDLGFFGRGQMVKPFEDAAFSLKKGAISKVVETRFGYHLIQVTDRKPEKTLAFKDVKEKLTGIMRREKIKAGTQKYVEGLREAATIKRF